MKEYNCVSANEAELAGRMVETLRAALVKTESKGLTKHGIHFVGDELLCRTETQAEGIADLFEDLGFPDVVTGYYDPKEDKQNYEVDEYTGWYYVNWG